MRLVVVYSSDNNYVQHTGVSILSLLDNNRHFKDISIYVIDNEISKDNKEKLVEICRSYKRKIIFILCYYAYKQVFLFFITSRNSYLY